MKGSGIIKRQRTLSGATTNISFPGCLPHIAASSLSGYLFSLLQEKYVSNGLKSLSQWCQGCRLSRLELAKLVCWERAQVSKA